MEKVKNIKKEILIEKAENDLIVAIMKTLFRNGVEVKEIKHE